jgi:2-polyprenyl-6-methoxyphenol hydroxylase-like FAD-dependent oxidoreductase
MQNEKRIAVVGGGPGGLTLARVLATRGISCTVFELDEHALARPQGGSLDVHEGSGQRALRLAGLEAEFRACARYDDQTDAIYDAAGTLHFEHTEASGASGGERPEIDRTQLRDLLLASLPAGTVRWGTKVTAIEPLGGGLHRVVDESGSLGVFDLVVGADGAWSKVRPLVSDVKPAYTGVTFLDLSIDDVDARHPEVAKLVPRGKVTVFGGDTGLIAQRSSGGHVRAYVMVRAPEDWVARGAVDLSSTAAAAASVKKLLAGWDARFVALVDACNDAIVPRPLVELPVGHRWATRAGVTLLGDAAHVMSPFSGEGVNMAMLDAAELAIALAESADWPRAVAAYEEAMFARAAEAAAGAHEGLAFVSERGLEHVLAHFRQLAPSPTGA